MRGMRLPESLACISQRRLCCSNLPALLRLCIIFYAVLFNCTGQGRGGRARGLLGRQALRWRSLQLFQLILKQGQVVEHIMEAGQEAAGQNKPPAFQL